MNERRTMSWGLQVLVLVSLGVSGPLGCNAEPVVVEVAEPVTGVGHLELPLITPAQGRYRLRDALFEIRDRAGTSLAVLDSEAAGDAEVLTLDLAQAHYSVQLQPGWSLLRLEEDGGESVVHAALLTPNPQDFDISNDTTTSLRYVFTTSDGTVSFGKGAVAIDIAVGEAPELQGCDLVYPAYTCPAGQTCLLADAAGQTFCASAGELPVGAPCQADQCTIGAQCLRVDPTHPELGVCTRYCNPDYPPADCDCASLSFSSSVGVCRSAESPSTADGGTLHLDDAGASDSSDGGQEVSQ